MLLTTLILFAIGQVPKTFEDLEIEKIKAYHGLTAFRETMRITLSADASPDAIVRLIELDGKRQRGVFMLPGGAKMETVCDGATNRSFLHEAKAYADVAVDKKQAFIPKDLLAKADAESVQFEFTAGGQPVLMACDPQFKLQSVTTVKEGAEQLRKAISFATKEPGRTLTLTQWFLADRWILKRFNIEGQGKEGPVCIEGVAKLEFDVKFRPLHFAMDPKAIEGYQKVGGKGQ